MPQQVRTRPQARQVKYSAGNAISEALSRGMVYREIRLRLTGALTLTAPNNTVANTKRGDEWAVVKRIELVANGTDVLRSIDGNQLWWWNYFFYGRSPEITAILGDGTTANPNFDSVLVIPVWMLRSVRPLDTALDSRELNSLELRITWGSHVDINSAATGFATEPLITISSLESFNVEGPFSQLRVSKIEKEIVATNDKFQIQLAVGKMYRGFFINTTEDGADVGNVLDKFKLISGTTVFADEQGEVLQQLFPLRNGLNDKPARRSAENDQAGWYVYDHVTDGFLSESIDTIGFSEMIIEAEVTKPAGTTKMIVYPIEIIPIRGAANNAA